VRPFGKLLQGCGLRYSATNPRWSAGCRLSGSYVTTYISRSLRSLYQLIYQLLWLYKKMS
jgi:hypothetical protein